MLHSWPVTGHTIHVVYLVIKILKFKNFNQHIAPTNLRHVLCHNVVHMTGMCVCLNVLGLKRKLADNRSKVALKILHILRQALCH